MTHTQDNDYGSWIGQDLVDQMGAKIGRIGQIYFDERTGQPTWATVRTGLFGTANSFVPLSGVQYQAGDLVSSWAKATVKDGPHVEDDGDGYITYEDEGTLYRYYGMDDQGLASPTGTRPEDVPGRDISGPTTDSAVDAVRRAGHRGHHPPRNRPGTAAQVRRDRAGTNNRARLSRRGPYRAGAHHRREHGRARWPGPRSSEEEHEVVLSEERPVVQKEVVPVERVRLTKDTVTEEAAVNETVRKERIEVENEGTAEETTLGHQ